MEGDHHWNGVSPSWGGWVTILGMVGDQPEDGVCPSLIWWVIILGMVGDHTSDSGVVDRCSDGG